MAKTERFLAFLLLILAAFPALSLATGYQQLNTPVSVEVKAVSLINLTYFDVTPISALQGSTFAFTVNLSNKGNIVTNVTLNATVYDALNSTAGTITFNQVTLFPGESQLVSHYSALSYPADNYRAVVAGTYGSNITNPLEAYFTITPTATFPPPQEALKNLALSLEGECARSPTTISVKSATGQSLVAYMQVDFMTAAGWKTILDNLTSTLTFIPSDAGAYRVNVIESGYHQVTKEFVILGCAAPSVTAAVAPIVESHTLLQTAMPGESFILPIILSNPSNEGGLFKLALGGIPSGFVSYPDSIILGAGESKEVDVLVSIPPKQSPTEYFITANFSRGDTYVTFPIAIKVESPVMAPYVSRSAVINYAENKTTVTLNFVNPTATDLGYVQLQERLNATIVNNFSQISFINPPTKVFDKELIIQWDLENVSAGANLTLSYEINYATRQFSALARIIVEQINVISVLEPGKFKISENYNNLVVVGGTSDLNVTFTNFRANTANISISFELPDGWAVVPENATLMLPSREQATATFLIETPEGLPPGTYNIVLRVLHDGVVSDEILSFEARRATPPPYAITTQDMMLFALLVLIVLVILWLLILPYLRRRKQSPRENVKQ